MGLSSPRRCERPHLEEMDEEMDEPGGSIRLPGRITSATWPRKPAAARRSGIVVR